MSQEIKKQCLPQAMIPDLFRNFVFLFFLDFLEGVEWWLWCVYEGFDFFGFSRGFTAVPEHSLTLSSCTICFLSVAQIVMRKTSWCSDIAFDKHCTGYCSDAGPSERANLRSIPPENNKTCTLLIVHASNTLIIVHVRTMIMVCVCTMIVIHSLLCLCYMHVLWS